MRLRLGQSPWRRLNLVFLDAACLCCFEGSDTELRSKRVLREGVKPSPTKEECDNAVGAGFIPARS
jgi:hypothetical protein